MNRTAPLLAALALGAGLVAGGAATQTAQADPAAPAATTAAHAAGYSAYSVSISVNNDAPELGQTIKIRGKVSPAAAHENVRLEVRYADQKKWKRIGTRRLNSHGNYLFKDKIGSVRERKYRVVKTASHGHRAGTSANVEVVSYAWRSLTDLDDTATSGFYRASAVSMNNVKYPRSLLQATYDTTSGSIGFNLNRDCTEFRGQVGLGDSSPVNGTAQMSLSNDGVQQYAGTFGLTQSAPVTFDVSGVFRLTVSSTSINGGLGAVGTPEVLCSF